MKCMSCEGDVSPKFAHAIATNCCPLCGGEIVTKELQDTLVFLKGAMLMLDKYPNEIMDWFETNYNLIPISVAEERFKIKKSGPVKRTDPSQPLADGEVLSSPEDTSKFFKHIKSQDTDHIKDLVNQIKNHGGDSISPEVLLANGIGSDTDVDIEGYDGDNQELMSVFGDSQEQIPSIVLNAAGLHGKNSGYNPKDMMYLQRMMDKQKESSEKAESGISFRFGK